MARGSLEGIIEDLIYEFDVQCGDRGLSAKDRLRVARMARARFEEIQSALEDRLDEEPDEEEEEDDEDEDYGEIDLFGEED